MKKLVWAMLFVLPLSVMAQEATAPADDSAQRTQMLYSLGFLLGDNLKRELILDNEIDFKAVSQGMRDSFLGKKSQTDLEKYKPQIVQKYHEDARLLQEKHQAEQQAYLETFQKEKGVKQLDNGVLIKQTRAGKGKLPKADDTVKAHYTGTLIDGTKFDSSRDRGEAFQTRLTDVIPCWTKAFQQLKPGARATVVCPAQTAYGNRPVGPIPANSVLVFDVELLEIVK